MPVTMTPAVPQRWNCEAPTNLEAGASTSSAAAVAALRFRNWRIRRFYGGNVEINFGWNFPVNILLEAVKPDTVPAGERVLFIKFLNRLPNDFMGAVEDCAQISPSRAVHVLRGHANSIVLSHRQITLTPRAIRFPSAASTCEGGTDKAWAISEVETVVRPNARNART